MIGFPLVASAIVALALVPVFQGWRATFTLRWQPDRHVVAAIAIALLPAALSAAALTVPQTSLAYRCILWVGIFGLCGFAAPFGYVLLVERGTLHDLGIRRERLATSLVLSATFAAASLVGLLQQADLSRYGAERIARALVHLNVGGLFELFLYCGLLHLHLRRAFGVLPAVLGSAAIYAAWHVGTELPLHPRPLEALAMLFVVGVLTQALFATTCNLLVVWPLFFDVGVLHDFTVNLDLPAAIGGDLRWPALGWALAFLLPGGALWLAQRRSRPEVARA